MKSKFGKFSVFLAFVGVLVFATTGGATTISWVDNGTYQPSAGGANPITYTLDFTEVTDVTYNANFSVETTADVSPEWRLLGFAFKFAPSGGQLSLNSTSGDVPGTWDELPLADFWNNPDDRPGLWDSEVTSSSDLFHGLSLTAGPVTYTWNFDITFTSTALADTIFLEDMPFQAYFAGEAAGRSGKAKTDRLSESLNGSVSVSEPATMLLLGIGIAGLAGIGRRKIKKN